jgi:hypothetical protein
VKSNLSRNDFINDLANVRSSGIVRTALDPDVFLSPDQFFGIRQSSSGRSGTLVVLAKTETPEMRALVVDSYPRKFSHPAH